MNAPAATDPRHLDLDAVMIWRTLAQLGAASVERLTDHWRPTFNRQQVQGALRRLQANHCVQCVGDRWQDCADAHMRELLTERRAA